MKTLPGKEFICTVELTICAVNEIDAKVQIGKIFRDVDTETLPVYHIQEVKE